MCENKTTITMMLKLRVCIYTRLTAFFLNIFCALILTRGIISFQQSLQDVHFLNAHQLQSAHRSNESFKYHGKNMFQKKMFIWANILVKCRGEIIFEIILSLMPRLNAQLLLLLIRLLHDFFYDRSAIQSWSLRQSFPNSLRQFLNLTLPNDCNLIPSGHGTRHEGAEIKEI